MANFSGVLFALVFGPRVALCVNNQCVARFKDLYLHFKCQLLKIKRFLNQQQIKNKYFLQK